MRQILGSFPLPRQAVGSSTSVPRFRRHCPSHKDLPQATSIKDDLRVKFLKKTITSMPYCFQFLCTHTLLTPLSCQFCNNILVFVLLDYAPQAPH